MRIEQSVIKHYIEVEDRIALASYPFRVKGICGDIVYACDGYSDRGFHKQDLYWSKKFRCWIVISQESLQQRAY